jgi:hypothetical protein
MAECIACDADLSGVTHRCRYCEEPVCQDHRLPENHDCVYQSMADAPSTKGVTGSATESSTWAGVRDVLAGNLPGSSADSTDSESSETSSTQKKTPPRKDTSDPDRVTWGNPSSPPDRSGTYPDDEISRTHPAEATTSRVPGARRDEPTAKSPDVETKQPDDAGHEWPTADESDHPTASRFWRATAFVLKLAVLAGLGYGAAWYVGIM